MEDKEDRIKPKSSQKVAEIFACESCDYVTSKRSNYDKHILTAKHLRMTEDDAGGQKVAKSSQTPSKTIFCCGCGKQYRHRQGLWKHRLTCGDIPDDTSSQAASDAPTNASAHAKTETDLIMMLIKDNNELRKMMMDQQTLMLENNGKVLELCKQGTHNTTHTNSHNKAFNLNFFLNETCKNAMNITDFAESIQLQLSDLVTIGEVGYVEGISNIIVNSLKALDVTERPIHCADKKREVIYIKDDDKWEKEGEDKKKLRKIINKVACKNQRLLSKFRELHPDCNFSESKYADQYSKIVIEAMGGAGNNDVEKAEKIIRNITKEVVINKTGL